MTTFEGQHFPKNTPPLFGMFSSHTTGAGVKNFPSSQMAFSYSHKTSETDPFLWPQKQIRHVQHASQWAETSITPGVVMTTRSATVTQWTEYSSSSQSTEISHTSNQSQIQTIVASDTSSTNNQLAYLSSSTVSQALDDLQLPTQQLDLAVQIGKGCVTRKGSIGGRRPPTARSRRSSQASIVLLENELHFNEDPSEPLNFHGSTNKIEELTKHEEQQPSAVANDVQSVYKRAKTPPPRPPPPIFRTPENQNHTRIGQPNHNLSASTQERVETVQKSGSDVHSNLAALVRQPTDKDLTFRSASSASSGPPPLPTSSPPPLYDPSEEMKFLTAESSTPASVSPVMTDVVEIHDKESIENGEVVRRRTIITLGPRMNDSATCSVNAGNVFSENGDLTDFRSEPETVVSGNINVTVKAAQSNVFSENDNISTMFVRASDSDNRPVRASAFNARRTIEQRRNAQQKSSRSSLDDLDRQSPGSSQVKSTYLYGETPTPATSSDFSSARTLSISMSFTDLDSENETQRRPGAKKNEAWYERRQSYGFEAADKLQSLLNNSNGSSDGRDFSSSSTRVSRSCDSLSSTVRSTSSNIEKMIPPWLKNSSPINAEEMLDQQQSDSDDIPQELETPLSMYLYGEPKSKDYANKVGPQESPVPLNPIAMNPVELDIPNVATCPIKRINNGVNNREKTQSASNLLEQNTSESEPTWLRNLKMRRSLRENRLAQVETQPNTNPIWMNVKLRPTGLKLVDNDNDDTPSTTNQPTPAPIVPTAKSVRANIVESQNILVRCVNNTSENDQVATPKVHNGTVPQNSWSTSNGETVLRHRKSIEMMKLLEETPIVSTKEDNQDDRRSVDVLLMNEDQHLAAETSTNCSAGDFTETSSVVTSVRNSNEDLTQSRRPKKVVFDKDVKEESDRVSRPRRIRSRSPETRLREWQAKLESKSSSKETTTTDDVPNPSGLPLTRFGDLEPEVPKNFQGNSTISNAASDQKCETSEIFRSLLQPRKPYLIPGEQDQRTNNIPVNHPNDSESDKPDIFTPKTIVNNIVNFDHSVERKIVVMETEKGPLPKSILKKRSLENLLDTKMINNEETTSLINVKISNVERPTSEIDTRIQEDNSATTLNTSTRRDSISDSPNVWKVHLKHVEPPLKVKSPEPDEGNIPWKAELHRKKSGSGFRQSGATFSADKTPSTSNKRQHSASPSGEVWSKKRNIPEYTSQTEDTYRNVTSPVVARCEIREEGNPFQSETYRGGCTEEQTKCDLGYHSLEPEANLINEIKTEIKSAQTINENVITEKFNPLYIQPKEQQTMNHDENRRRIVRSTDRETSYNHTERRLSSSIISTGLQPITPGNIPNMQSVEKDSENASVKSPLACAFLGREMLSPSKSHRKEDFADHRGTVDEPDQVHSLAKEAHLQASKTTHVFPSPAESRPSVIIRPFSERNSTTQPTNALRNEGDVGRYIIPDTEDTSFKTTVTISTGSGENRLLSTRVQRRSLSTIPNVSVVESSHLGPTENETPDERNENRESSSPEKPKLVKGIQSSLRLKTTSHSLISEEQKSSVKLQTKTDPLTKPLQLTSGMAEDKATLLVRKFFGNSIIETKKGRITKTDTILEESPTTEPNSPSVSTPTPPQFKTTAIVTLPEENNVANLSFDSDELFQISGTEMSSEFGSAFDLLDSITDDDRSIKTTSSKTLTKCYSSCSERSVKLSDIINRPSVSSASRLSSSIPSSQSSSRTTPENVFRSPIRSRIPLRLDSPLLNNSPLHSNHIPPVKVENAVKTGTDRSKSEVRVADNSTITDKTTVAKVQPTKLTVTKLIKEIDRVQRRNTPPPPPPPPQTKRSEVRRSSTRSASTSDSHSATETRTGISKPLVSTTNAGKTENRLMKTNPVKLKSAPTVKNATTSKLTMKPSNPIKPFTKVETVKKVTKPAVPEVPSISHKAVSSSTPKTNRLVTISSYKCKKSSSTNDEVVSGVAVTPVAVKPGHYKIRMEQRICTSVKSKPSGRPTTTSSSRTKKEMQSSKKNT